MTNQTEKILNYVHKKTDYILSLDSYIFDELNALNIGLDLNIDRTNVSRLLNKLHNEDKLIKKKGRPTLYISKNALFNKFPELIIPNTLNIKDDISTLLTSSSRKIIQYNEFSSDSDFLTAFNSLIPAFYYPKGEMNISMIYGEKGVGKKDLATQLFLYSKRSRTISDESDILFYKSNSKIENISLIEFLNQNDKKKIGLLCINTENISLNMLIDYIDVIQMHFSNQNMLIPPLIFLIDNESVQQEITDIIPFKSYLPSLSKKNLQNKVNIIIDILYSESIRLKKSIIIDKVFLLNLCIDSYPLNLFSLKNRVLYEISLVVSTNNYQSEEILLTLKPNQNQIDYSIFTASDQSFIQSLSDQISISFNKKWSINSIQSNTNPSIIDRETSPVDSKKISLEAHLLNSPTNIDIDFKTLDKFSQKVYIVLKETPLKYDPGLLLGVTHTIRDFNNEIIDSTSFYFNDIKNFSTGYEDLPKRISRLIQRKNLLSKDRLFLKNIIYYSLNLINITKIPTLISSKSFVIDSNYAHYINLKSKKRAFLSLSIQNDIYNSTIPFSKKAKIISEYMGIIDRGNGTLLVNDFNINKSDYKNLLLELRSLAFSIRIPSLNMLTSIIKITDKSKRNIISLSPKLIQYCKNNENYYFGKDILTQTQLSTIYKEHFSYEFKNLNSKFYFALYDILCNVANSINITLTNNMILDFIFIGSAIINNNLLNKHVYTKKHQYDVEDSNLFESLKHEINKNNVINNFILDNIDFYALYRVIYNNQTSIK